MLVFNVPVEHTAVLVGQPLIYFERTLHQAPTLEASIPNDVFIAVNFPASSQTMTLF